MEDEKDIVERLEAEVEYQKSVVGHNSCSTIIEEAAREIEELRSLIDAMKENR